MNYCYFYLIQVKIEAYDDGLPNQLRSTLALTVNLIDINDKLPEFPRQQGYQPYIVGSAVEEQSGVLVGSVDVAIDRDSDANNSQIFYYIVGKKMYTTCISNFLSFSYLDSIKNTI